MKLWPLQLVAAAVVLAAGAAVLAAERAATPPQVEADIKALKEARVDPTDAGLLKYLVGLRPTPEVRQAIKRLLAQLASENFDQREEAGRRLAGLAGLARTELEGASRGKDPEVARRAKTILADHEAGAARREAVLLAALREVTRRKVAGVGPLLLEAPAVWERPRVREAAERVLAVADGPADVAALRRALDAPDGHVRFAAALTLLNHGDRGALPVLGELLDSPDLMVRHRARRLLGVATGQEIGFAAYEDPAVRAKGAAEWRRWIRMNGATAPLTLPAPAPTWLGRVLVVAVGADRRLLEFGQGGEIVWETKHSGAWWCQGLADGHRLVGSIRPSRVDEYDAEGKLVWSLEVREPLRAVQRLPGGNTLVAEAPDRVLKVREYRPDKNICSELELPAFPQDLHRLDGGNILAAFMSPGRVVELDRLGKAVWVINDLENIYSAQRVDNGNTLISDNQKGQVVEVDRSGKIVWAYKVRGPTHAHRLPDGHTVIATVGKVFEIDAEAKVLWMQRVKIVGHLSAY
jgi:HEAT repeat protein